MALSLKKKLKSCWRYVRVVGFMKLSTVIWFSWLRLCVTNDICSFSSLYCKNNEHQIALKPSGSNLFWLLIFQCSLFEASMLLIHGNCEHFIGNGSLSKMVRRRFEISVWRIWTLGARPLLYIFLRSLAKLKQRIYAQCKCEGLLGSFWRVLTNESMY